jgi:TRAP-type mannitol/chloroaromatic compound transport system permease small subunit
MVLTSANVVVVSFRLHSISSTELGVIQWPLQLIVPIGFGLLLLESLVTLSKNLTASSRKVSNDPN